VAGESVLIIDDDDGIRRLFGRILSRAEYRVSFAEDGLRGLAMIQASAPDLVLVDVNMPELGGLEVLARVTDQSPETPIIVISGTGVIDDVVQALRRGAWDYVSKPIEDTRLLLESVRRALERASLLRQTREQRARLEQLNGQLTEAVDELRADQEAGRRVQFQLLPSDAMQVDQYQFSRRLFPSQCLSGDFVDYFALGDHHVGMYIADVSGHGAASAFVTAMVAALVGRQREAFTRGESDVILWPDRLLESLNRDLGLRKLHKHVTMFYGVLDMRSHRLSFCNAGHYPFPLFDDGEHVHLLECSGRPLGLFPDVRFSRREASLDAARRLLLLSDGVLDISEQPPGPRKIEQLMATFHRTSDIDSIVRAFGIDPTVHYRDDVTMLLVERGNHHA
jgi:sigma-B regulation protein RsbU (phosphoserine phosphatase)